MNPVIQSVSGNAEGFYGQNHFHKLRPLKSIKVLRLKNAGYDQIVA